MKKAPLGKLLEFLEGSVWLMVIYAVVSCAMTVSLLVGMPYERTVMLYVMVALFLGTFLLTAVLFGTARLFFGIFGKKKIPESLAVVLGNVVNFCSIFLTACFVPVCIIVLVYFFSLFKVSVLLFLLVCGIYLYLGYGIMSNNRILSKETDIDVIQSFRAEWSRKRMKWVVLLFVVMLLLMALGVREHRSFSVVDCIAISIYLLAVTYYIFVDPYVNTYSKEYSNKDFVFFLRSFLIDNSVEEKIISDIHDGLNYTFTNKVRILRIGNPSLTMYGPAFGADTFFLPTEDWQPVVRRYINDSKAVVVLINVPKRDDDQEDGQVQFTQGVIWELYNNIEHRDKFIYCIDKISSHTSSGYLDLLDEDKKEHSLTKCIVSLLDQAESTTFPEDRCVFTYDGENCVLFNELKEAVKHVLGERSAK